MMVGAALNGLADATATVVEGIGVTTNLVSTQMAQAAAITPGLRNYVVPLVHRYAYTMILSCRSCGFANELMCICVYAVDFGRPTVW
jgi:hypothetical protein